MDTSDRKAINAAKKRAREAERARGEVLINLMSTTYGRAWVWELLERLHVFGSPIGANSHQTYFLLGEQNAGKQLMLDAMRWCPDLYIQAMREANERRTDPTDATDTDPDSGAPAGEQSRGEDTGRDVEDRGPDVDDTGQVRY